MDTNEFITKKTYHIQIKESHEDHIIAWFGKLTMHPQENGEIFLDLSFTDQETLCDSQDPDWDDNMPIFSMECTEKPNIQMTGN